MNFSLGMDQDGNAVVCDLDILSETRLLVNAQSGGGKTTLLRRIAEQTHGAIQQIIIDPEGEFYTLRDVFDYIIAGKGGDCAADPRSAKLLAHRLLELGVSAVCDLSELKAHARIAFVRAFLEALVDAPRALRHPVLVVIDEAHVFAPEKGQAESAPAVIDLCARGRKRGLCALLATQRLSKLHKDAAAEMRNVLIGATGLDIDQQRAGDVLGFQKADRIALRDLTWGQFFAYGPALSPGVIQLKVGETKTQNPKLGQKAAPPAQPTQAIRALLSSVADLPAEAEEKAKTEEDLRRELASARRDLTLAKKAQPVAATDEKAIERAVNAAKVQVERQFAAELQIRDRKLANVEGVLRKSTQGLLAVAERMQTALEQSLNGHGGPKAGENIHRIISPISAKPSDTPPDATSAVVPTSDLTGPEQRVLNALAWWETVGVDAPPKANIGFIAGYRVGKKVGGTFGNILGQLRSRELIVYPNAGAASLTESGRAIAQYPPDRPTRDALHDAIHDKLDGPESRVLAVLIAAYPEAMSKQEIGAEAGYTVGDKVGGTFGNILGKLRSLGLIDYPSPGTAVATHLLFPEGL